MFHPRDFALLSNCQAICLPYGRERSRLSRARVYLKPHYLPAEHSYWRAKEAGPNMSARKRTGTPKTVSTGFGERALKIPK